MKKVKIGSLGLGRLGLEHAQNLAFSVPGAELVALCDLDKAKLAEVAERLGVPKTYNDFEEMCKDSDLDAIVIVSPSPFHTEHIRIAMENGKHVFCEKPLDTTVEKCQQAEKVIESHPDLVFMLGFMRRFDKSYMDAYEKIQNGDIGRIIMMRLYTQDPKATMESTLKFAPTSGGQFLDMSVHDIDLVRWMTKSEPKRLWSIGGCYEFEEYRQWNDGDNVSCLMQCEDDTMAFLFAGRAAAHGSNVETEIIGTNGTLRIASVPSKNLVEVMCDKGVCRECYVDFMPRWHDAFIEEMNEFCSCILEGKKPEVTVYDGTAVSRVAYKCKESFECGKQLDL